MFLWLFQLLLSLAFSASFAPLNIKTCRELLNETLEDLSYTLRVLVHSQSSGKIDRLLDKVRTSSVPVSISAQQESRITESLESFKRCLLGFEDKNELWDVFSGLQTDYCLKVAEDSVAHDLVQSFHEKMKTSVTLHRMKFSFKCDFTEATITHYLELILECAVFGVAIPPYYSEDANHLDKTRAALADIKSLWEFETLQKAEKSIRNFASTSAAQFVHDMNCDSLMREMTSISVPPSVYLDIYRMWKLHLHELAMLSQFAHLHPDFSKEIESTADSLKSTMLHNMPFQSIRVYPKSGHFYYPKHYTNDSYLVFSINESKRFPWAWLFVVVLIFVLVVTVAVTAARISLWRRHVRLQNRRHV